MMNRLYGLALTLFLSLIVLFIFFGNILRNPNNVYFSTGGDGFKAYYGAIYHARFDSLALRSSAMNYPFGEVLPFTDSQPLVVNSIRILSENVASVSDYTVAIINLMMLLSIVLGAVFIYLIMLESKVSWWFAAVVAVGIAMLSPQIGRMGGHFSLSWVFWIPLMIWLIIRFDKSRWLIYSFLMGITTFMAGFMHFYFIGFFGFLIGGYWLFRFLYYRKASTYWYRDVFHLFLQFILPLLLLQFLMLVYDDVTDRPTWPFALWSSVAHPVAIFLPSGSPWPFVSKFLTVFRHIGWESFAWVGTVAMVGFWIGLALLVRRIYKKDVFHRVSHVKPVNVLFWVSVIALLFSFGIPFVFGLKQVFGHFELLRQLRVLARFSWLFFYLLNIVVFASLFHSAFASTAKLWLKVVALAAVILLLTEGTFNLNGIAVHLNNRIAILEDYENTTIANSWVNQIEPANFQAIIPVPYFHIGSENIWIDGSDNIRENTMLVSLKTGLPTTGVELSRTSISQTYINYALFTDPLERLEITEYLPNEKPFLVLKMNSYKLNDKDSLLLDLAKPILETTEFKLLSLPVAALRRLNLAYRDKMVALYKSQPLWTKQGWLVNNTEGWFDYFSFDGLNSTAAYKGSGALQFPAQKWQTIWEDTLRNVEPGTKLLVSFWVKDFREDAYMRTNIEVSQTNSLTGESTSYSISEFFRSIQAFSGDWALIEFPVEIKSNSEIMKLAVSNTVLPEALFTIDELLIREKNLNVFQISERFLEVNGRRVILR